MLLSGQNVNPRVSANLLNVNTAHYSKVGKSANMLHASQKHSTTKAEFSAPSQLLQTNQEFSFFRNWALFQGSSC